MIKINGISKKFDSINALTNVSATIEEGQVFGLIGTNGAGKSTLMRTICGIYLPTEGEVLIDDEPVFENPKAKSNIFYISDDQFYYANSTPNDMVRFYSMMYPEFDLDRFYKLMEILKLDPKRKINTFSKGMKKQVSVLFGVCANTKYLLCDETFDGLDPVIRQAIKRLFITDMEKRGLTPIIASHNLRELEDICDHIGLLHKGGILFSKDLDEMKLGMYKLQVVPRSVRDMSDFSQRFPILRQEVRGSLYTLTLRCTREEIMHFMEEREFVFWELLPLTLEEIFISETEVLGYDFEDLAN